MEREKQLLPNVFERVEFVNENILRGGVIFLIIQKYQIADMFMIIQAIV
jgi:hypothetical protein